jgi:HSP20 family protein
MLTGWDDLHDTFRALSLLQRGIDNAFDDWTAGRTSGPWLERAVLPRATRAPWPAINAFETKGDFVYKVRVPGLAEGDVSVYVEDGSLIVRGEFKNDVPEGYEVRLRERVPMAFARTLPLPGRVEADLVTATMKDGILTITLPKAKETLPRQIAVKSV